MLPTAKIREVCANRCNGGMSSIVSAITSGGVIPGELDRVPNDADCSARASTAACINMETGSTYDGRKAVGFDNGGKTKVR